MDWVYNDGGREADGYRGETDDCVCRAVAIASGHPYSDVYAEINDAAKCERRSKGKSSARTGVHKATTRRYMESIGWQWTPTMHIGSGCTTHMRADELPDGPLVVQLSKHCAAVIDGVLHDTADCTREGTRCVYGYYQPAQ